jgi:hypothetical protein
MRSIYLLDTLSSTKNLFFSHAGVSNECMIETIRNCKKEIGQALDQWATTTEGVGENKDLRILVF